MSTSADPVILLTAAQLAHRWQVAAGSLANDRSAGRGVPFCKIGERVRYRVADVEAYEAAQLVRTVAL